ncbi:hypothetical protein ACF0H5_023088 [Mactra antiquata]
MVWTSYIVAMIVVGASGLYVWNKKKKVVRREAGKDYPSDTVILHQFPRGPYAPSMSAFCIKLETFLRMANVPYKNVHGYKTGPKGKIPWIEYNNEIFGDSEMIMAYLNEKLEINLNKNLTPEQKAIARAFQKLVDEHMYWTVLMERWVFRRSDTIKAKLSKLPSIVLWEIGRRTKNMAHAHGIGRHSQPEMEKILLEDLTAISDFLGDKQFMFGDEPTQVDCAIFGHLIQVKHHVPDTVKAKQVLQDSESLSNLNNYYERLKQKYWPDWDECITDGFTKEATK